MTDHDTEPDDDELGSAPFDSQNIYDPETHRITGTTATPEERSARGRAMQAAKTAKSKEKQHARAVEMVEFYYGRWDEAPPDVREAAEQFAAGKTSAGTLLGKRAGTLGNESRRKWDGKGPCPTCNRTTDIDLSYSVTWTDPHASIDELARGAHAYIDATAVSG